MKNSNLLKIGFSAAMSVSLWLVACGDSSTANDDDNGKGGKSIAEVESEADISVETYDKIIKCNTRREGVTVYVKDEKTLYTCEDGEWEKSVVADVSDDDSRNSTSLDDDKNSDNENSDDGDLSSGSKGKSSSSEGEDSDESANSSDSKQASRDSKISSSSDPYESNFDNPTDGVVKRDSLTQIYYTYDEILGQWIQISAKQQNLGLGGCTTKLSYVIVTKAGTNSNYVCIQGLWEQAGDYAYDLRDKSCTSANKGEITRGLKNTNKSYYCMSGYWYDLSKNPCSFPKEVYLNPDISYGEMTDPRDGQKYKTVGVGHQLWMAENLNYADSVRTPSLLGRSWCDEENPKNCAISGRLYTWSAAIDSVSVANDAENPVKCGYREKECKLPKVVRGICPEGWHIPSRSDFSLLFTNANKDMSSLLSQYGNGNDSENLNSSGFSAFATKCSDSDYKGTRRSSNLFWSTDHTFDISCAKAYAYLFNLKDFTYKSTETAYPVRCIFDETIGSNYYSEHQNSSSSTDLPSLPLVDGSEFNESASTLKDLRNGRVYKTIKIGDQVWMAENLNFEYDLDIPSYKSSCKEPDSINCSTYGRRYSWAAVMDSVGIYSEKGKGCGDGELCGVVGNVRGICPEGWHVPCLDEWKKLIEFVGGDSIAGRMLKSTTAWKIENKLDGSEQGVDAYGFSALPSYEAYSNRVYSPGAYAEFGTTTEYSPVEEHRILFENSSAGVKIDKREKFYAVNSVRCLKD